MKTQLSRVGVGLAGAVLFVIQSVATADVVTVRVGVGPMNDSVGTNGYGYPSPTPGLIFTPSAVSIKAGDSVQWVWDASDHSTTSGTPGHSSGLWESGIKNAGATFTRQFTTAGTFAYYCSVHGVCCGMTGSVTVAAATPTPTPAPTPVNPTLANIATRGQVQTGANVLIGGFIVTGDSPKKVLLRAIGPSLSDATPPVPGVLADPVLELHEPDGTVITNDNWKLNSDGSSQQTEIEATTIPPTNDAESAIVATLDPLNPAVPGSGAYTAIVSGKNGGTGVGLVEMYDLDLLGTSVLANISTRGFVGTDANVLIGGLIILGASPQEVLVRAIGPSLTALHVDGALADPVLELHDSSGNTIATNDNWKVKSSDGSSQQAEIEATTVPPTNDAESAILMTLPAGAYTAIVRGQNNTTGVALVEVFQIDN